MVDASFSYEIDANVLFYVPLCVLLFNNKMIQNKLDIISFIGIASMAEINLKMHYMCLTLEGKGNHLFIISLFTFAIV